MPKKAHIIIDLVPEASEATNNQILETIKCEAKIPFCKQIEIVTIDDADDPYMNLKNMAYPVTSQKTS